MIGATSEKKPPASVFAASILRPCFLAGVDRKPRTLWAWRSPTLMIPGKVAPFGRPISSGILASVPSARGVPACLGMLRRSEPQDKQAAATT
jgi:hypothetical protein